MIFLIDKYLEFEHKMGCTNGGTLKEKIAQNNNLPSEKRGLTKVELEPFVEEDNEEKSKN